MFQERVSMLGEKGLGVELHALHGELTVAYAHDLAVFRLCRNLQALGQARSANRKRMIAGRHEGTRQSTKHAEAGMADRRGFPVYDFNGMHDLAAESLADRLMAEAHAQYRDPAGKFAYRGKWNPRFAGIVGRWGNDDAFR